LTALASAAIAAGIGIRRGSACEWQQAPSSNNRGVENMDPQTVCLVMMGWDKPDTLNSLTIDTSFMESIATCNNCSNTQRVVFPLTNIPGYLPDDELKPVNFRVFRFRTDERKTARQWAESWLSEKALQGRFKGWTVFLIDPNLLPPAAA
jgi:hypothetical protein